MALGQRKKAKVLLPVSSMADIAFLLLIFFMLSSIADADKEIPIRLPESRIAIQETKKYFNVWIDREGNMYFGGKKGTPRMLTTFAQYRLISQPEVRALIRAEKEIPYKHVNTAMEALKKSGVHNVVLVSKKYVFVNK